MGSTRVWPALREAAVCAVLGHCKRRDRIPLGAMPRSRVPSLLPHGVQRMNNEEALPVSALACDVSLWPVELEAVTLWDVFC